MSKPNVQWLAVLALLLLCAAPARAQQQISGRVTAAGTGEPISGVRVAVRGTSASVHTDANGRYALVAPSSSGVLVFVRIGFARQAVPFEGQTEVNAVLAPTAIDLEGPVVVAYGEKSRATLTESVGTVSIDEIQQVPVASPEVAIQGRVSGIQVQSESGNPGAPIAVRMRGIGTVGNTQPLYVIDGLPVGRGGDPTSSPLATINPDDIESISVLKDASAAALYGVQAANGVVLIQTRRGRADKPTVEYRTYAGVQNFSKRYRMLNSAQWFDLGQESFDNYNAQFGYTPDSSSYRKYSAWLLAQEPDLLARNTDWHDVVAGKNAPIMNQSLSVSGASDRTRYYVSASYFRQDPIISPWNFRRVSFRVNGDFQVSNRVRFGETFAISHARTLRGQNDGYNGQLLVNALSLPPFFRYRDEDGSVSGNRYGYTGNAEFSTNAGLTFGNEPGLNRLVNLRDGDVRVLGGLFAEVDPLPGLTVRSHASLDYGVTRNTGFSPNYTKAEIGLDRSDYATEDRSDVTSLVWANTLTYTRAIGLHRFNLIGGTEMQQARWNGTSVGTTNLITFDPAFVAVPTTGSSLLQPPGGWAGERAFLSFLGRVSYSYADKYLATVSLRRDGASTFAPEHRWGTFPAVSAGWRISQEPFFKVPWISELKLRGSWGRLGNSEVPGAEYPHLFQVIITPDYGLNGQTVVKAPAPRGFVNPNLFWETNETTDVGIESGLFDNRLFFSATYYRRDTKNFLVNVPVSFTSGFSRGEVYDNFAATAPVNSGLVRNTGLELEAAYTLTAPAGIDVRLGGNLTTVHNELVSLREGIEEYSALDIYRTAVGYPIDYFFGYKTCGIYQTAAAAAAALPDSTIGNNRAQAGDVCFQDVDGRDPATGELTGSPDGVIDEADRTYLGKAIPDFYFGLTLNATYRRFDLSLFFSGVGGVQKYNAVRRSLESVSGGGANRSVAVLDHWTPTNPSNTMPRAVVGDPNQNDRLSDRWIEDASYVRLRTAQVGYTLPPGLWGLKTTRLWVSATNLFTLTQYRGLDPEFTTSIDYSRSRNEIQQQAGTDRGNTPQPRQFQIGVSTTF
jgi:TonB-linked SusC/RagA family outer membrane protein